MEADGCHEGSPRTYRWCCIRGPIRPRHNPRNVWRMRRWNQDCLGIFPEILVPLPRQEQNLKSGPRPSLLIYGPNVVREKRQPWARRSSALQRRKPRWPRHPHSVPEVPGPRRNPPPGEWEKWSCNRGSRPAQTIEECGDGIFQPRTFDTRSRSWLRRRSGRNRSFPRSPRLSWRPRYPSRG